TVLGALVTAPRVTVMLSTELTIACGAAALIVACTGASGVPANVHVVPTAGTMDSDAAPDPVGFDWSTFADRFMRWRAPYDSDVRGVARPERLTPPTTENRCGLPTNKTHTGELAPEVRAAPSASFTSLLVGSTS